MDQNRFDALTRSLTSVPSRRDVVRGLAAVGLGLVAARLPEAAMTKKKRKQKLQLNAFGCVDVGRKCYGKDARCCSGVCKGKTSRSRCVAHDSGFCTLGIDFCGPTGPKAGCDPNDIKAYYCLLTTGNAPFCGDLSASPLTDLCRECRRDADCRDELGAGAACVLLQGDCAGPCAATGGRACVAPGG